MRTALLASAACVLSLACESGAPAPDPQPGEPPVEPAADADQAATGAPSDPVAPLAPAVPPSAAPPGEQRFVTVERLDADAECDPLAPARIPEPVAARVENPGGRCAGGVSDGSGHVSVRIALSLPWGERQAFSPRGTPEGRFVVWDMDDGSGPEGTAPQRDGWIAAHGQYSHGPATVTVLSLLGDGTPRRSESFAPVGGRSWAFAADPRGGGFLVVHPFQLAPDAPCTGEGRRFDGVGSPSGGTASVGCNVPGVGVSTLGEALAIEHDGGRSIVHWVRPDGSDARPPTDEGDLLALLGRSFRLEPLLDGSIAARTADGWVRRYPHLAASGEPAPAWLAARGRETFRFTRGNRGYAFFPPPGQASADCRQTIELVAPSGRRCVRLTFREDTTACTGGAIDQGWDGTVVQQSGKDPCAYRWWPGLLGG